ncbi:hypothetical protein AAFC00_000129 [Neodothiora populina]|uniref:FAD dependent oxidoreductase domain-containing protein n=1 Tax=Neodothiora populina TaxID=2781224 RepID=A0ABR3P1V5_9PEZI
MSTSSNTRPSPPSTATTSTLPSPNPTKSFWHAEPSPLLLGHRSTRELPKNADVVVIGSGITGASAAWHLLNDNGKQEGSDCGEGFAGLDVVMLEAREACWGATGRNGGHCQPIIYQHAQDPSIGHFELANLEAIKSLCQKLNIDCELHVQPGVRALYSQADVDAAAASLESLERLDAGLAKHARLVTDASELQDLRIPTATGAIVSDTAARLWPYKFVAHILETLLTSPTLPGGGAFNLQTHTPATSIDPSPSTPQSWIITTPRGTITAKKVILATNAYTSYLLRDYSDLIVPVRGQMSSLLPPPSLSGPANRTKTSFGFLGPAQDDYLIQRDSRPRGGGSEQLLYGGGRSQGFSMGVSDDSAIGAETAVYLRTALNTLLGLGGDSKEEMTATHEWTGIMGFSRDDKPFVGPLPHRDGLFLSAGYTGHGMPNAWLCGRAVAGMVLGVLSGGKSTEGVVADAVRDGGLPRAYLPHEERVAGARLADTVEVQDRLCGYKAEFME